MRGEQGDRAGSAKCHTIPTETDRADVAVGSDLDLTAPKSNFRFSPGNGHRQTGSLSVS